MRNLLPFASVTLYLHPFFCRYVTQTASAKEPSLYMEIGSNRVEGAQAIVEYLSRPLKFFRGRDVGDIDRGLSAEQRALSRAVTALLEDRFMAAHGALQFVQHGGKFYRDIMGAYPPKSGNILLGGTGTTRGVIQQAFMM